MKASSISGKSMSALKKATELPHDICEGEEPGLFVL